MKRLLQDRPFAKDRIEVVDAIAAHKSERNVATGGLQQPGATTVESIFAAQGKRVVQLATEHRLPGLYPYRFMAEAGGLMAFDSFTVGFQARTAIYVDKILKGANPSDLPVERPTKFELIINLKTARSLGLTISASLLARADEVIE